MTEIVEEFERIPRFEEFLKLGDGETDAAVQLLAPAIDSKRKRALKSNEAESFRQTVGLVVANALVSERSGIHYSRRYETYSGSSPYKPPWLGSKRLLRVIDTLAEEGLLRVEEGRWAGTFLDGKGQESSLQATPLLIDALKGIGLGLESVSRDEENAPVIKKKDRSRRLVRYDPNDEFVLGRSKELKGFNAFIRATDISAPGERMPCFSALARTYNEDSWERGGRHFSGWWQQLPSEERAKLLIEGRQTVELDFEGFNTRALYHLTGQQLSGDPYDIPEARRVLEEQGLDWETKGRGIVKRVLNILIGASSDTAIYKMEDKFPGVPLRQIVPAIRKYHAPIRDCLGKGMSNLLMNKESAICNGIIMGGMSDGAVILPIFDSFITTADREGELRDRMAMEYQKVMEFDPNIH